MSVDRVAVEVDTDALIAAVVDGLGCGVWDPSHVPWSDTYLTVISEDGQVGTLHVVDDAGGTRNTGSGWSGTTYRIEWGPHQMVDGRPQ